MAASAKARSAASRLFNRQRAAAAAIPDAAEGYGHGEDGAGRGGGGAGFDSRACADPAAAAAAAAAAQLPAPATAFAPHAHAYAHAAALASYARADEDPTARHVDKRMRREFGIGGGGASYSAAGDLIGGDAAEDSTGGGSFGFGYGHDADAGSGAGAGAGAGAAGSELVIDAGALRGNWMQQTLAQRAEAAAAAVAAEGARKGGKVVVQGKVWSHEAGAAVVSGDVSRVAKSRHQITAVAAAALAAQATMGAHSLAGQKTKAQTRAKYGW